MTTEIDLDRARTLEEQLDPEMQFRPLVPPAVYVVGGLLFLLSLFHYYTAGFGLLPETTHRGVHLAFVLGLSFLVFPFLRSGLKVVKPSRWFRPGGVALVDWLFAIAIALSVLYVPWIFHDSPSGSATPTPPMW